MLFRSSRRWLEAQYELAGTKEARIAAYREHFERMRRLEELVSDLVKEGLPKIRVTMIDVHACEYSRVQAELWLVQANAK